MIHWLSDEVAVCSDGTYETAACGLYVDDSMITTRDTEFVDCQRCLEALMDTGIKEAKQCR